MFGAGVSPQGFAEVLGLLAGHRNVKSQAKSLDKTLYNELVAVESRTKTKRVRHGPVPGPVWDRLKDELPADANALEFPRQRGGLLLIEEYRRAFDKGCAAVGIEGLVPHGLRAHHGITGDQRGR